MLLLQPYPDGIKRFQPSGAMPFPYLLNTSSLRVSEYMEGFCVIMQLRSAADPPITTAKDEEWRYPVGASYENSYATRYQQAQSVPAAQVSAEK
ncbi:hypothetical protein SP90_06750 [Halodesulfovibrio spirochaetisodalis]|uniref:Uncharacterized protein n=1 Tax=Halodesulfovibrio spirochaetisodalis TaxID=1560234 RepID=A0A1B7XEQ7_9BACT|nr:hypothetical protein SP90_06750 [Halodesulfovibrio spirochaetisodalis]